ncbi:MAG: 16S rRNA (adenine(1518)-N(6)/adenine(1519)-N(6))-dimethyltransferase RsmA [Selenomonadaceae bacterium]|nr:16S rRNA (adenine(1518)-N(6)/adenine(1519)-N(6))-dimethyltransferase RsmA [Selenomonadaceae bacterium]MBP3723326.1 16S rRNA (adenine(1518)-N(6)/adenine(1519)-N(6))-dimethyltransferase RsmA [Selenomonadaceae bacterium]
MNEETLINIARIPVIRQTKGILKHFKLRASHRLGQNFLIDETVANGIVAAAEIKEGERVLEIGPGIGSLSEILLNAGAKVTAVELDKKLPEVLNETLAGYDNFTLISGDILKVDLVEIMGNEPYKVVANLPYYITTPILLTLLEKKLPITKIVTMIQKEVAERITANPGGKDYGAITLAFKYFTDTKISQIVSPKCFYPAPEVTSAVIVSDVLPNPFVKVKDEELFFKTVRAAFGKRRKTLSNALKSVFDKEVVASALEKSNIDGARRGETLSIEEFAILTDNIAK